LADSQPRLSVKDILLIAAVVLGMAVVVLTWAEGLRGL